VKASGIKPEVAVRGRDAVGEGPVWLQDERRLMWVDITSHLIKWFDPATGHIESIDIGRDVGAAVPLEGGGVAAILPGEFVILPDHRTTPRTLARVESDKPGNRMNDGKCDSRGRFWAGTMAYDLTPHAAALYRLNADCSVDVVIQPVTLSNGLGWSPDDTLMYYIDSKTQRIDVFDYEPASGHIANRRLFVAIPSEQGMPDGMTVDASGCVWVGLWGGSAVHRYRPDGTLDLVVDLPASQITSCAFGGDDLGDLYITSAAIGLDNEALVREPDAGSVFRCRPGPKGLLPFRFTGCADDASA
jgi:sugar lactone lactonase YvrE